MMVSLNSQRFSIAASIAGIIISVSAMIGWILDIPLLRSVSSDLATMKFNTALCFLLLGSSLYASNRKAIWIAQGLAGAALGIAALTLFQHITKVNLGIDQLFMVDTVSPTGNIPGRMSIGTAINLILLATALLLFNTRTLRRYTQLFSTTVALIAFFVLLGYLYEVSDLYRMILFETMALHTAVTFLILALGLMALNPDNSFLNLLRDVGPAGQMTRRLFPSVIFIPALLGWVILLGERVGLYSNTNRLALFVICIISMLLIITWLTGLSIQRAIRALHRTQTAYRILSNCNQTLIRAVDEQILLQETCRHIISEDIYICAQVYYREAHKLYIKEQQFSPDFAKYDLTEMPAQLASVTGWMPGVIMLSMPDPIKAAIIPMLDGLLVVYSPLDSSLDEQEMALLTELAGDMAFGIRTIRNQQNHLEAEAQLVFQANLLENVQDAVIATDANFHILYWNKAAEKMYGWSAPETTGLKMSERVPTEYINDFHSTALDTLHKEGYWRGEVQQQHKEGHWLQVMASVALIHDISGQATGVVAVNRDMTKIRENERRQLDVENRFKMMFENAMDVIIVVDGNEGKIIAANNAIKRMLGYEPDELAGCYFAILFPPANNPGTLLESLKDHQEVTTAYEFQCKDGSIRIADFSANLIPWDEGHALLVFLRDVTERLEMERRIIEAELTRAQMEKERALIRQREQVIATVSHEFRTPLTVIHSSTQILERYPHRLDDSRRQELYFQIHAQIEYMLGLIQDMLDFTNIRAKTYRSQLEIVNLNTFCKSLFDQLQMASQTKAEFIFESHGTFEMVTIDKPLLNHILINLIGNAIKYSPNGGKIRFLLVRESDSVIFEVSDEGIGIPEEDHENLFKPFFRGGNVEGIGGTGLGMAIIYESVQSWGGEIHFESKLRQGTTFTVRLPLKPGSTVS